MDTEARRASASFSLFDGSGHLVAEGEGLAVVDDDGLTVGPHVVKFLDAEDARAADWAIEIDLWPSGRLLLSRLARRFETFAAALGEARGRARIAGLLAHGIDAPAVFRGRDLSTVAGADANLLVYATHLTVAPDHGDPYQIPYGAVRSIELDSSSWTVCLATSDGSNRFGQLGRMTEAFFESVTGRRAESLARFAEMSGSSLFSDGAPVHRPRLGDFDSKADGWTAPEREPMLKTLMGSARSSEACLVLAELLDPDGDSLEAKRPLPENTAAFLLVPGRAGTIVELLSGPSAATYVFESPVDSIGRDLQLLHYRRRPLSLSEQEGAKADSPYRLAFRKLEPLKRLRAAARARVIHDDRWAGEMASLL